MGALSSLATTGLNAALATQAARRQSRNVNDTRDRQIEAIERRDAEQRRRALDRLRRELASQRARAGAAGIGGSATSTAVLRGLVDEAESAEAARQLESTADIDTASRNARLAGRRNLLDLTDSLTRSGLSTFSSGRRSSLLDF
jgi:hypothetical protein